MKFHFNFNNVLFFGFLFLNFIFFNKNIFAQAKKNDSPLTPYNPFPEMSLVKGGKAQFGNDKGEENERPTFASQMRSFYLDNQAITVAQFRLFARINRYITTAEMQGFSEKLVNNNTNDNKNNENKTQKINGAYWEYPLGKNAPKAKSEEPARHLSWADARAFAIWLEKRLPTEFELEFALQNTEKYEFEASFAEGLFWHWSESSFSKYDAQSYYDKNNKNPLRVIKGGAGKNRASARIAQNPNQTFYELVFRCARDEK
jgi:formylglycine-generating enzyme required for sulfatase activity